MKKIIALLSVLVLSFAIVGCSMEPPKKLGDEASDAVETASKDILESDELKWSKMSEAFAVALDDIAYMSEGKNYVFAFETDDGFYSVKAVSTDEIEEELATLDFNSENYQEQNEEILGSLDVVAIKDITDDYLDEDALEQFVGMTGEELMNEGFTFSYYVSYGGSPAIVAMNRGAFAYTFDFDIAVEEEDLGEAILDEECTFAECFGYSDAAVDITNF